jgi:hypothetical protein
MGLKDGKSERDLLVELCTDVRWIKDEFGKHLAQHRAVRCLLIAASCTATVSLVLFGLNLLFRHTGP